MAHGAPLQSSTGFLSKIFSGTTIPPVGVFAPKIGTRTCPPFCMVGGKVVFTPSALTNPKPILRVSRVSTGGTVVKGRPVSFRPGLPGLPVPPNGVLPPRSSVVPPGRILPRPKQIFIAGNTISEPISTGSNVNFPNRLKNIEIGGTQKGIFNTLIIGVIAVGLLFVFNK